MAEEKRIFITVAEPKICKHQMSDVIEYHDGNYGIDVWCGLSKERIKCNQSNCEKKEYDGIGYGEAIEKMAKALCNWYYTACSECALRDKPKECKALLKDANFYEQAESELNALLENK